MIDDRCPGHSPRQRIFPCQGGGDTPFVQPDLDCEGQTWLTKEGNSLMNTMHKKPVPLYDAALRAPCPVCGHVSYSPAGIHPQCAMHAADLLQIKDVKARRLAEAQTAATHPGRFEKQCPKCRKVLHIRKQTCDCGHSFQFKNGAIRET